MPHSQAWYDFISNLREATQLLGADPSGSKAARRARSADQPPPPQNLSLSQALAKACVMLVSGRLQGCIESQVQEFLECIDQSGVETTRLPERLRGELCVRYEGRQGASKAERAADMHKRYATLWMPGAVLVPGTLRTDAFSERYWNPRPGKVAELVARCDIDLFRWINDTRGPIFLSQMREHVDELIDFRNEVAHGGEPPSWTVADVLLRIRWVARLARICDEALGEQLQTVTGQSWQ